MLFPSSKKKNTVRSISHVLIIMETYNILRQGIQRHSVRWHPSCPCYNRGNWDCFRSNINATRSPVFKMSLTAFSEYEAVSCRLSDTGMTLIEGGTYELIIMSESEVPRLHQPAFSSVDTSFGEKKWICTYCDPFSCCTMDEMRW